MFLLNVIQYLPKVWERARERERTLWIWLCFSAIRKIQFSSDRDEFFLAVAIIESNKLMFFSDFSYQGEGRFKMDP
jgi:hypothetical protein